MRRAALFLLLALLLPLRGGPAEAGPVLFVSADGLAAEQFSARSMPKVWALAQEGRRGAGLPPFPATTYNGHITLATGCWPEHHGVVANSYRDPGTGKMVPIAHRIEDVQREPLWVAATRSGVRTAVYHWVGATGPWEGVTPWRMERFTPGHPDAEALAFSEAALRDGARLVMTYLSGTDGEGHTRGPRSDETRAKLARLDGELAPWLQRLRAAHPNLRVILTADHGMTPVRRRVHLPSLLDGIGCELVAHGGSAYVYLRDPGDAARALRRLRRAGLRAWPRAQVPARHHLAANPRVGDLVVLAPEGKWLSQARSSREEAAEWHGRQGAHAYSADTRAMHAWLVVLGAGRGPLGAVPLWDLAPTVAAWLDIRWAQAPDGRPVAALLP